MAREFRYLAEDGYGTVALFDDGSFSGAVQHASTGCNTRRADDGKWALGPDGTALTLTVTQSLRRECRCRGRCAAGCVMRAGDVGVYACRLEGGRLHGYPGADKDGAVGSVEWAFDEKRLP